MKYQTFDPQVQDTYPLAVLVPKLEAQGILQEYITPSLIDPKEVIAYGLHQSGKKTPANEIRAFLDELLPVLDDLETEYLLVSDGEYFKILTGVNKADAFLGYVLPNTYPATAKGRFNVIFIPNFRQVFYDPGKTRARITQATDALWTHRKGHYASPGASIIHSAVYPTHVIDIAAWLQRLIKENRPLTCDIEGFSLKHFSAGIGTISFAWNKHNGIAFAVDLGIDPPAIRRLLIRFFIEFKAKLIFHNASYDVNVLIYQLFMEHLIDTEGLLNGLEIFFDREWDDTKIIAYLATNTCAGNELGLKVLAQEFAGNYAVEEIKDITQIPLPKLLEYNLVDALSTWYVYEKYQPIMIADDQGTIYEDLFKPALIDIVQMQLTGMPLDMKRVKEVKAILGKDRDDALQRLLSHKIVREMTNILREEHVDERNAKLVKKRISFFDDETQAVVFNPGSVPQKQRLLYELVGLPVIERTKTKAPATGASVLEKLKAFTEDPSVKELLTAFNDFAVVDKIYGTFIPAMESAVQGPDGHYYLFGNFNLGGTVSGRLSSSDPNLQTIPSGNEGEKTKKGRYGKLIKSCFVAPDGQLLVGLDFASLEDKISALTTKDRNKLKVYTDGYDGHSLRAQSYFGDQMPDIELAPEGARCFRAMVGTKEIFFHEQETVTYAGQTMTGLELWDRLENVRTMENA